MSPYFSTNPLSPSVRIQLIKGVKVDDFFELAIAEVLTVGNSLGVSDTIAIIS